jgi:hypothetical protein
MAQFSNALPRDSSSAWKQAYECAILELDVNKLPIALPKYVVRSPIGQKKY